MRVKSYILIGILSLTIFCGCNRQTEVLTKEPIVVEHQQKEEMQPKDKRTYREAYYQEMESLIAQFGKYQQQDLSMPVKGVKYANLIDFDTDGVPELVVLHDMKLLIYQYQEGKTKCIYEETLGSRYGQTDVAYTFGINTSNEYPYLLIYQSEQVWIEESIQAITLQDSIIVTQKLYATADVDNDISVRENLKHFFINDQEVLPENYNTLYESLQEGIVEIDANWNTPPATYDDLESFLKAL